MPRVLVLGATGFLGSSIARSLLLSGLHTVFGLSRSASKGNALATTEILPVICPDPSNDPSPYLNAIKAHRIDIVIDATAAYGESLSFLNNISKLSADIIKSTSAEDAPSPKLGYIYISGLWVHGNSANASTPNHPVTDRDPVGTPSARTPPLDIVGWRPALEREILKARNNLDVCILRPAQMYGYTSAPLTAIFAPVLEAVSSAKEQVDIPLANGIMPVAHVDDVAAAACNAASRLELLASGVHPVFDLVGHQESATAILQALADSLATLTGKTGGKRTKVHATGEIDDVYLKALGATINASSARAKEYLNWTPKRAGLMTAMDVYARAWKAGMEGGKK